MKLNRGCGCLLAILGLVNLVLAISCLYFAFNIPTTPSTPRPTLYVFAAVLFVANLVASGMLALVAVRGATLGGGGRGEEEGEMADGSEVADAEGEGYGDGSSADDQ
jgi:hypothetical protein